MTDSQKARWQLIVSMTVFGTIGVFVRYIPLTSGQIALCRAVLATVLIGGYLLVKRQPLTVTALRSQLWRLLVSGAAMGFNWILLFQAYRYTTVSVATLSYYFAPVLVTVLCPLLFRERMTAKCWLCFVGSTVGLVLITGIGDLAGDTHLIGIGFGLGAAVLYATVVLLNKSMHGINGLHRTFFQFLAATVVLTPYVLLTDGLSFSGLTGTGWTLLLVVGLIHTGVTYCLYFSSLGALSGQQAAILSYIDPLVAVLCSVTILQETMTPWQMAGGVLILGCTLSNEITLKKSH